MEGAPIRLPRCLRGYRSTFWGYCPFAATRGSSSGACHWRLNRKVRVGVVVKMRTNLVTMLLGRSRPTPAGSSRSCWANFTGDRGVESAARAHYYFLDSTGLSSDCQRRRLALKPHGERRPWSHELVLLTHLRGAILPCWANFTGIAVSNQRLGSTITFLIRRGWG
jgi:hypothetical protein